MGRYALYCIDGKTGVCTLKRWLTPFHDKKAGVSVKKKDLTYRNLKGRAAQPCAAENDGRTAGPCLWLGKQGCLPRSKRGPALPSEKNQVAALPPSLTGAAVEWQFAVANSSAQEQWLEIRVACQPDFSGPFHYWNGIETVALKSLKQKIYAPNADPADGPAAPLFDHLFPEIYYKNPGKSPHAGATELMNKEFSGISSYCVFPMQCLWNDREGVGIGLHPKESRSYASGGFDSDKGGLFFGVKVVLRPQAKQTIKFIILNLDVKWGWRSGLSQYYRLFPENFSPRKNIPGHIGPGETYYPFAASRLKHDAHLEDFRRFRTKWTWGIKENVLGALLMKRQYGKKTAIKKELGDCYPDFNKYHKAMRAGCDKLRQAVLPFYGITCEICDHDEAEKHFRDSFWTRSDGSLYINSRENINLMNTCRTSYGRHLKEDAADVVKHYRPAGFIFDNCGGPRPFFGRMPAGTPGVAFTQGQKYATQGAGHADIMRFMQALKTVGGQRAMVAANTPADYMTTRHCDIAIIEAGPWSKSNWSRGLRYLMGKKPIVWWGPKGFPGFLTIGPGKLVKILKELNHELVLFCLESGGMPNPAHAVRGFSEMRQWLPAIINLAEAGWEPVTGAVLKGQKGVKIERFGNRFLSMVNYSEEKENIQLQWFRSYDNDFSFCLCPVKAKKIRGCLDGKGGAAGFTMQRKSGDIFDKILGIKIPPGKKITFESERTAGGWKIKILAAGPGKYAVSMLPCPDKNDFYTLLIDGKETAQAKSISLASGTSIEGILRKPIAIRDRGKIKAFPFYKKNRPFARVCLPIRNNATKLAAKRLQVFFQYYYAQKKLDAMSLPKKAEFKPGNHDTKMLLRHDHYMPREKLAIAGPGRFPARIIMDAGYNPGDDKIHGCIKVVENDGCQNLYIGAKGPFWLNKAMDRLFALLEKKYPLTGDIRAVERQKLKAAAYNLHVKTK